MRLSNYPPGVSGNEPEITGDYHEDSGPDYDEPEVQDDMVCPEHGKTIGQEIGTTSGDDPFAVWSLDCGHRVIHLHQGTPHIYTGQVIYPWA